MSYAESRSGKQGETSTPGESSGIDAGGEEAARALRGVVREHVTFLRTSLELLHSPRVGPRQLRDMLVELEKECTPMRLACVGSLAMIERRLAEPGVGEELGLYIEPRLARLAEALRRALAAELDTRARLVLEQETIPLGAELLAAHALLELLDAAVFGRPTEIDLRAVLDEAHRDVEGRAPPAGTPPARRATFVPRPSLELTLRLGRCAPFLGNAKVTAGILAAMASLVREAGVARPLVTCEAAVGGGVVVRVGPNDGEEGRAAILPAVLPIPPTLRCLMAATAEGGATLSRPGEGTVMSLVLPCPSGF